MKVLTHGKYGFSFALEENQVYEIVIESAPILAEVVSELIRQTEGGEGEFRLSEKEKLLSIEKNVVLVKDIFNLDVNQRKVLTKLYSGLSEAENAIYAQEKSVFLEAYISYLDYICAKSDLFITYEEEPELQELLKVAKVKIDTSASSLLEQVIEYIKVLSQLLGQNIFVFVNLKLFLTQEDMEALYTECFNRKICLILIEAVFHEKLPEEKGCIIDKDTCIIYF